MPPRSVCPAVEIRSNGTPSETETLMALLGTRPAVTLHARDHVMALTGVLTAGSLALVFGAVIGALPATLLPHPPAVVLDAIPHVNAGISLLAIGTIAYGWRSIRQGAIRRHRTAMVTALVLFASFLLLYLYRVGLEGPTPFPGPDGLYTTVYLPILTVHVSLAVVCIPLLYYVVLLALTRPVSQIPQTHHPRIGRVAAVLWLVSFSLGIVVYSLLYVVFGPVP